MLTAFVEIWYGLLLALGLLATLASTYSIFLGRRFSHKVVESLGRRRVGFQPQACVIMACKGYEPNLEENIGALLKQNYPNYRVRIVTDSEEDPAYGIAEKILKFVKEPRVELLTSTQYPNASGKVSALLTALGKNEEEVEVYAFVDSDATISSSWLSDLVDPLSDASVGATTGFRWYFASGFWSEIQSAWNASGSNLMFDEKYNFPWGGAMALRKETLNQIHLKSIWKDAVSDDLTLNIALRVNGYHTIFLPQCTVATFTKNITRTKLLKWVINQTALTRTYHRRLWNYALTAYLFFNVTFILGLVALTLGFLDTTSWLIPCILLLTPLPLGIVRSRSRRNAFKRALPWLSRDFEKFSSRMSLSTLIVPWIMTFCIFKSISTREIEWRGRSYSLRKVGIAAS